MRSGEPHARAQRRRRNGESHSLVARRNGKFGGSHYHIRRRSEILSLIRRGQVAQENANHVSHLAEHEEELVAGGFSFHALEEREAYQWNRVRNTGV